MVIGSILVALCLSCTKEARMHNHADWTKDPKDYYEYGCYLISNRPQTKFIEGFAYVKKAAEGGHPEAMWRLGSLYAASYRPDEIEKSVYWYSRAANAGDQVSMNALENANRFGLLGLPVDVAKADEWHRRFEAQGVLDKIKQWEPTRQQAMKGNLLAMVSLGRWYQDLGEAHWKTAVEWYGKAAEAGDAESAMKLVQAYREPALGLPKDLAKSDYWFSVWQRNIKLKPPAN